MNLLGRTGHTGAVSAAVEGAIRLYAVSDNPDPAVFAGRSECVDGTLEAVENVGLVTRPLYPEGLIVLVTTNLALCHLPRPLYRLPCPYDRFNYYPLKTRTNTVVPVRK